MACKLLKGIAKIAAAWYEAELVEDLNENAAYFEALALATIDNMYEMSREDAYASLVALLPFRWSQNVTPLSIADSAECMRFMGHACCQTLLQLIWMHYMDLDTASWKLLPVFAFFPFINIPMITFDEDNLSFTTSRSPRDESSADVMSKLNDSVRVRSRHVSISADDKNTLNGNDTAAIIKLPRLSVCSKL